MAKKVDYFLLGTVVALVITGILILSNASFSLAQERFGSPFYYLNHQIIYGIIPGIIFCFFLLKIPMEKLKKLILPALLLNLLFMGLVFVPGIGMGVKGASRWISIGPISFQPSEFLKITFILYLASWLSSKNFSGGKKFSNVKYKTQRTAFYKNKPTDLISFCLILGLISLFLIKQPDIGTLGTIIIIAVIMYFLARAPLWHVFLILIIGILAFFFLIKIAPYRADRLLIFLNPQQSPLGIGYHLQQSLIAIGSGGIKGIGLGLSRQRFGFLPDTISDSIFAIFAEETGFIGSLFLITLFLIFLIRGFQILKKVKNDFLQLAGFGIVSWITLQAFINIGAMIGVIPLTGIPLPFVSYGGSAIMVELIGVGILLNISKFNL